MLGTCTFSVDGSMASTSTSTKTALTSVAGTESVYCYFRCKNMGRWFSVTMNNLAETNT